MAKIARDAQSGKQAKKGTEIPPASARTLPIPGTALPAPGETLALPGFEAVPSPVARRQRASGASNTPRMPAPAVTPTEAPCRRVREDAAAIARRLDRALSADIIPAAAVEAVHAAMVLLQALGANRDSAELAARAGSRNVENVEKNADRVEGGGPTKQESPYKRPTNPDSGKAQREAAVKLARYRARTEKGAPRIPVPDHGPREGEPSGAGILRSPSPTKRRAGQASAKDLGPLCVVVRCALCSAEGQGVESSSRSSSPPGARYVSPPVGWCYYSGPRVPEPAPVCRACWEATL